MQIMSIDPPAPPKIHIKVAECHREVISQMCSQMWSLGTFRISCNEENTALWIQEFLIKT